MDSWETMQLKREIFSLFEYTRTLFNSFYNYKDTYSKTDIKAIYNAIKIIKEEITCIEEEIKFEIGEEK